jgi:hypothetical protein
VPYFVTAAMIAAETDAVASLPERAATALAKHLPIKIVKAGFPMPVMGMSLAWHERSDADGGGRFFRDVVLGAVKGRG